MDSTYQVLNQLLELFYVDIVSLALDGTLLLLWLCRLGATGDMRRHLCIVYNKQAGRKK